MTQIKLEVKDPISLDPFDPDKGQVFQIVDDAGNFQLVMYTDEGSLAFLTGDNAGYIEGDPDLYILTESNLVNKLEITATLKPL